MTLTCPHAITGLSWVLARAGLPPNERFDETHQISITQRITGYNIGLKQSPDSHNDF